MLNEIAGKKWVSLNQRKSCKSLDETGNKAVSTVIVLFHFAKKPAQVRLCS